MNLNNSVLISSSSNTGILTVEKKNSQGKLLSTFYEIFIIAIPTQSCENHIRKPCVIYIEIDVSRPRMKSEPELRPTPQLQQYWIRNSLCWARIEPAPPQRQARSLTHCTTVRTLRKNSIIFFMYRVESQKLNCHSTNHPQGLNQGHNPVPDDHRSDLLY